MIDPKISIIMPVYNSGEYLSTAVESILNQSFKDFELIMVDDGSTDGSSELCDEYARKDSRIVVIHQKNGGICNARNAALDIARGEYVTFSDHDDEYLPRLLEDNYNYAQEYDLDFVKFCKKWVIVEDGRILTEKHNGIDKCIIERENMPSLLFKLIDNRFGSCVWDTMFKFSFLKEYGIRFDPFFKMGGEDYDFNFQCLKYVRKFGTNDKTYYLHVIRNGFSTSSKPNPQAIECCKRFINNAVGLLGTYNIDISKRRKEYAYLYSKFYLSPIINNLRKMDIPWQKKKELLDDLRKEPYYLDFWSRNSLNPTKHGYCFFILLLYRCNAYKLLFRLYKVLKRY